ncbi:MAG: hypothetical protein LBB88_10405 [Planctomycetaceae bacterium]|nr:hypothetical protein [Planctomycetaceae bacterium]
MPCVSLFDQKITDRDARHCVSTFGLAIQIRILKPVNGYKLSLVFKTIIFL